MEKESRTWGWSVNDDFWVTREHLSNCLQCWVLRRVVIRSEYTWRGWKTQGLCSSLHWGLVIVGNKVPRHVSDRLSMEVKGYYNSVQGLLGEQLGSDNSGKVENVSAIT